MGRRDGKSLGGGDFMLRRPQTDQEWDLWHSTRKTARGRIQNQFCQVHEKCREQSDELITILGLESDRWGI